MAKYRGRDVTLNKPFRLSGENKKFGVYVKNQSTGNVKRVTFGQVGAVIKRNNDVGYIVSQESVYQTRTQS